MKLRCLQCGYEFEGSITKDYLGWHSSCPECNSSFDVDVPTGRIVMMFSDDSQDDYIDFFTDSPKDGNRVKSYYAFDTLEEFIEAWYKQKERPDGMWYWVLDGDALICSGACDPEDIEGFVEHFGIKF